MTRAQLESGASEPSYQSINRVDNNLNDSIGPSQSRKEERGAQRGGSGGVWCGGVVTIQVPVFLYFVSLNNSLPITQYYLTTRMYEEMGVPNVTMHCSRQLANDSNSLMDRITDRVADYTMYTSFLGSLPAFLPVIFLGSLSNRLGRKAALYLVTVGTTTRMALYALVFHYGWPIPWLYLGSFLEGLTGGYGSFLMGSYAMVADVTKEGGQRRVLKIALTEAATMIGSSAGTTMAGYWITSFGFVDPLLFSIGLQILVFLYLLVCIPETVNEREATSITCSVCLKSPKVYLKSGRRFLLLTALLAFFLAIFNLQANNSIILLYLINYPFCWSQTHFSLYAGIFTLTSWLLVLFVTITLGSRLSSDTLTLLGVVSGMVGFIFQGLSHSDLFTYLAAGTSLLSNIAWPMLRAIMSKAVDATEQGVLFAGIGTAEMLATTSASVVSPIIYKASLGHVHGLPFLCYAGLDVLVACLVIAIIFRRKWGEKKVETPHHRESQPLISSK